MTFTDRIRQTPRPFDPDRGAEIQPLFPQVDGALSEVLVGAAGCSPYLKGLMERETAWLCAAFDDPEAAIETLFDDLREIAPDELPDALRQAKRRVALITGLADVGGVWSVPEVTGTLTRFADLACHLALRATIGAEIRRKKMPGARPEDAETACGMVALSMGKGGAFELNYSSDVDLICLFDESRFDESDYFDARASFVRATRRMTAMLNDQTGEGYVFRMDLRLRPDPSVTPVCMAMEAAERYYESLGRTWERAAYIKARPAAGDLQAGARFLQGLRPFVWRKHLDFAAIQDAHDMRLRIREHKGLGGAVSLPDHNMKLGRGGIREIEFFTQTRQLIAGGRDPELRVRGTIQGLEILAQKGWIDPEVATRLSDHYFAHRTVEHRLQMINDAQTHSLPKSPEGMERLACFLGVSRTELEADLHRRLEEVHELTEGFFAPDAAPARDLAPSGAPEDHPQRDFDAEVLARWPTYPALRSARAVEIFRRLEPEILRRLQSTAHPHEALIAFDGFLAGLPAGVQLFSLFEANPQLIDLLVDIVGTAPELAQHLSRNSSVFDAVIGGDFFAPWPGQEALQDELRAALSHESDYERKLDMARRWAKEWHFCIGVHHLRGLIDAQVSGTQYADLAQAALAALWPVVVDHFAEKHGPCPGRGAMVLGMGSLGAGRLNAASDLDLIVIYDADGVEYSEGRRPLAARPYYARLTQAMVTAVTAPMSQGRLYEIDMRLRPSGTQGPVATSLDSFRDYQTNQAWLWEHLALTRARPVAGSAPLCDDVETFRQQVLKQPRKAPKVLSELSEMRERIASAKSPAGPWDGKIGGGRLQDIELLAQAGAVVTGTPDRSIPAGIDACVAIGWLSDADGADLIAAYMLCWQVQSVAKLLSDKPLDPETIGEGGLAMLLRDTNAPDLSELGQRLQQVTARAEQHILRLMADGGSA